MSTGQRPVFNMPDAELVRQHGRVAAVRAGLEVQQPGPARTAHRPLGSSLRIAVVVPRTDIGGGARILFELSDRLLARGHRVEVLSYAPRPDWFDLRCRFQQVPVGLPLAHAVPACDLVLAGYWELVPELTALQVAPVVHVEQGDFHLFEELPPPLEDVVRRTLALADAHTVVSGTVSRILRDRYAVEAEVVPNAVDPAVFHPPVPGSRSGPSRRRSVLAVGWDGNAFKGIDVVRRVAERLRLSHPDVDVVWVTPKPPQGPAGAIARVVVAPRQPDLAALYRDADAYLCASAYESFPLPPMEAMACGTPVISTENPGSLEYCRDGENALLVPLADPEAMHRSLVRVLDDGALADRLRAGGSATASSYTWDAVVTRAEAVYRRVAEHGAAAGGPSPWVAVGDLEPVTSGAPDTDPP